MRTWMIAALAAGLAACDDDGGGDQHAGHDTSVVADMGPADAAADAAPDAAPKAPVPAAGLYYVGVRLNEVGAIEIGFQAEIESTAAEAGGGTITRFVLRAVGDLRALSAPLFEVTDLAVDPVNGTFTVPETTFTLPAAFSPSGSDVEVRMRLDATATAPEAFCGTVAGEVITIETPLNDSTFAALPWGFEGAQPPADCAGEGPRDYPRAEACPDLVAGLNTITTGEQTREFLVFLPANHDPTERWPLVLLHNGLGGTAQGIVDATQMDDFVDDLGFVLIAPDSYAGGGVEWDSLSPADSPDLALFDDLLRCSQDKLGVDPARIHVSGMSAGGLYTGYLAMYRAEVIASAVAGSGGLLAPVRADAPVPPFLMMWGGEADMAVDTDFNRTATEYLGHLAALGRPAIACNHGQGHEWLPEFTPWALEFLLAHRLGDDFAFSDPLPMSFPEFCELRLP